MIIKDPQTNTYSVVITSDKNEKNENLSKKGFKSKQNARDYELSITDFNLPQSGNGKGEIEYFEDLADAFVEEKRVRVRLSTFISYRTITDRFIRPSFSGMKINYIEPANVRAWQNGMMKLGYSQHYLRKIDSVLSSIFEYGVKFYGMKSNPSKTVGSIGSHKTKKVNFWTLEEFEKFIVLVKDKRFHLIYNMLYWTGLRVGELLALTPKDVDIENMLISVTKTYCRWHKRDIISPPKTKKSNRTVFIHNALNEEIKQYFKENLRIGNDDRMFPVTADSVRDRMTRIVKKAGLKRIKVHDLRHSHASLLINMNITPLMVSERLGHEKVETTLNIYSHLYPEMQQKLMNAIEDVSQKGKIDDK